MMGAESKMNIQREKTEFGALIALFVGALCTGGASVLVRITETGPIATAFWRGCIALPFLAVWALLEPRVNAPRLATATMQGLAANARAIVSSFRDPGFRWAGAFFAGDLAFWNGSLLLTSVAASTLESSLAPLFVTFFAWLLWRERPSARFMVATALAITGVLLMISPKFGHMGAAFTGDALGVGTAVFYAGYLLAVARLRARYGTGTVLFNSTLIYTMLLFPLALTQKFLPDTLAGWGALAGCALAAQLLGQGLIAYALAHLRPTFSSLGLLVTTLSAATSAWLVLGERLAAIQIVGGLVIVGAIAMARSARQTSAPAGSAAVAQP